MTDDELAKIVEEIEEFIINKTQSHKVTILNLTAVFLSRIASRIALLSVECKMRRDFTYLLNSVASSVEESTQEEQQKETLQ
jgi:hypothetical protein